MKDVFAKNIRTDTVARGTMVHWFAFCKDQQNDFLDGSERQMDPNIRSCGVGFGN